jgi:regulator of sirC expression with transglutaminase-like and TPR domain
VGELVELLSGRSDRLDLDRAALELASIEYPQLDISPFLALLDSYAAELESRLSARALGFQFVAELNHYLFSELGFTGNAKNYYDPRNSCLNEVLTARTGIPITLSLVYMEIARRLGRPVYGIGLPGHFVVQYDDGEFSSFIDPFHGGSLLTAAECFELARRSSGEQIPDDPAFLARVDKRHMIQRMINNLRSVYFFRRSYSKALKVLDLLIAANPQSADEYKQRSVAHLEMKAYTAARADLERYLMLAPQAPDREQMEHQLRGLRQYMARLN